MSFTRHFAVSFGCSLLLLACSAGPEQANGPVPMTAPVSAEFSRYWYAGQAELSRYELQQNRYDDTHPGEAVLVFVTEDFLPVQQVKMEGGQTKETAKSVLKMNQMRRFTTGIYDYSINTSVSPPAPSAAARSGPTIGSATPVPILYCVGSWEPRDLGSSRYTRRSSCTHTSSGSAA